MRLRCARCGCYVSTSGIATVSTSQLYVSSIKQAASVQPCKRCLREAQQQAYDAGRASDRSDWQDDWW